LCNRSRTAGGERHAKATLKKCPRKMGGKRERVEVASQLGKKKKKDYGEPWRDWLNKGVSVKNPHLGRNLPGKKKTPYAQHENKTFSKEQKAIKKRGRIKT